MPHSNSSAPRDSLGGVRLARGASPWLLPTVATAAVSLARARRSGRWAAVAVPATALAAGMLWFFRDPEREITKGRVISPADGVVQSIMPWKDGRTRVAIFMSPLNVHVNRAPLAGTITSVEHIPGGYVPARRIVPYVPRGCKVEQGDRIGLIRFGSRVDVYLPAGIEPDVEVGQTTTAGVTRLDRA
jgi:phosphatidylserine decarboxylase